MSRRNDDSDDVLSGFNPFAVNEPVMPRASTSAPRPVFTPAVLPESPKANVDQNEKVFRDIKDREKALNELENQIQKRENELKNKEGSLEGVSKNNFPPIPSCCPFKPCFYQDCDVEIAAEYRGIVKLGFYIWLSYSLLLFINVFGTLSYMIHMSVTTDAGTLFGVSLLMFILMPPLVYILCFRPLYRAFRSQNSVNFFVYFAFFAALIIIMIIQSLGITQLGSCGWIISLSIIGKSVGIGAFMLVITIGFTLLVIISIFLYIKVHRTYRSTGATFSKAKEEMRNQTISAALHP